MPISTITWSQYTNTASPPAGSNVVSQRARLIQDELVASGACTVHNGNIDTNLADQFVELRIGTSDLYIVVVAIDTLGSSSTIISNKWTTNGSGFADGVLMALAKNPTGNADPFNTVGIWSDADEVVLLGRILDNRSLETASITFFNGGFFYFGNHGTGARRYGFGAGYIVNEAGEQKAAILFGATATNSGIPTGWQAEDASDSNSNSWFLGSVNRDINGSAYETYSWLVKADTTKNSSQMLRRATFIDWNINEANKSLTQNFLMPIALDGPRVLRQVYYGNPKSGDGVVQDSSLNKVGYYMSSHPTNVHDTMYFGDS